MDCIQTENKAVDLFGAGNHGFQAGNPSAGLLATFVSPAWCNGVQEEILNVIRAGGIVPDGTDLSQLLQAISAMISVTTGGPGEVKTFARPTPPAGWLKCNGDPVSRTTYSALFSVIGTTFGAGDGATTFNLPNLCGEFVRGWDDGRGVDAGRAFGSTQGSSNLSHVHTASSAAAGSHDHGGSTSTNGSHTHLLPTDTTTGSLDLQSLSSTPNADEAIGPSQTEPAGDHAHTISADGSHSHAVTVDAAGGAEARPRNVALLYCISF